MKFVLDVLVAYSNAEADVGASSWIVGQLYGVAFVVHRKTEFFGEAGNISARLTNNISNLCRGAWKPDCRGCVRLGAVKVRILCEGPGAAGASPVPVVFHGRVTVAE